MVELFDSPLDSYEPRSTEYFQPTRIILTRGWNDTNMQTNLAKAIMALYRQVEIIDQSDRPHNRVELEQTDLLKAHYQGKKTLVLGVHKTALRFSEETDNTCPNYWHFSCYGFCPFDCSYCYLAGTPGVKFSPTVKIFLNVDQIIDQIAKTATQVKKSTSFYLGKLQDGLALDPLTGFSRRFIRFFAQHEYARQILLTKSADVDNLLDLEHNNHTILSWSLNPPEVSAAFETNVPPVADRINAMQKCVDVGYPVRAVIMPIIPIENWRDIYSVFLTDLLQMIPFQRITLGQICSFPSAIQLTEQKLGTSNPVSNQLERSKSPDGRTRFPAELRTKVYRHLIQTIKGVNPGMQIGLCLEEKSIFDDLGMRSALGCCNCVL
jgi:spore photoproduct lyase